MITLLELAKTVIFFYFNEPHIELLLPVMILFSLPKAFQFFMELMTDLTLILYSR